MIFHQASSKTMSSSSTTATTLSTVALLLLLTMTAATASAVDSTNAAATTTTTTSQLRRSLQSLTNQTTGYVSGPQVNQDRFVDFEYCYGALKRHDTNANGRVEQLEYLQFVQDLGSNTECLGGLTQLPLELMACWNQLSCECRARGGSPSCCEGNNAHIPISGVDVLSEADASAANVFIVEEQQFLRQTCLRTDQCVIAFCGTPPPPIVPPPPIGIPVVPFVAAPAGSSQPLWWLFFLLIFLVLCCCRRRWWFVTGPKPDDDESEASSESEIDEEIPGGGARHAMTEQEGPPPEALAAVPLAIPDDGDPDANRVALRSQDIDEDNGGGGVAYSRTVQEPEWEEDPIPPAPKVIEQFDPPTPPQDEHKLRHVEKELPPPPPEDPYALEKYTPDGGIVEYEREGEWRYDADGGWTPEERATKDPTEWNRQGYDREVPVVAPVVDRRKDRHLDGLEGGGAIFDHLDEDDTQDVAPAGGIGDMFSWVISSTLNTLDQKQDDLRSSGHGSHTGSDNGGGTGGTMS